MNLKDKRIIKSKKAELPVGNLYIASFLILLSLAGASLYLFLEGQSTASSYRISTAAILELSEQLKQFVDQERLYVIETALFFLSSQGGIGNIKEYGDFNVTLVAEDIEANACTELLTTMMSPSSEMLMRCYNGLEVFDNVDSQGIWKCDVNIYSYKTCEEISKFSAKLCCDNNNVIETYEELTDITAFETIGVTGQSCHQGCLRAMAEEYETKCNEIDYCGALFCKENYIEIPETKEGVPYYYKLGENSGGGYYCLSSYQFNPEKTYEKGTIFVQANSKAVIDQLVELAGSYFYMPMERLNDELKSFFNKDVTLTFKLSFKGCTKDMCEFAWLPVIGGSQEYSVKGLKGKEMVNFKTNMLSIQSVPLPIEDIIDFSIAIIEQKRIVEFLTAGLKGVTYNIANNTIPYSNNDLLKWKEVMAEELYEPKLFNPNEYIDSTIFDFYDERGCGTNPFTSYDNQTLSCLMKHASTSLYESIQNPFTFDDTNYLLRPIFRFVKTSMGGTIPVREEQQDYTLQLLEGDYQIFIKTKDEYLNYVMSESNKGKCVNTAETMGVMCLNRDIDVETGFCIGENYGSCDLHDCPVGELYDRVNLYNNFECRSVVEVIENANPYNSKCAPIQANVFDCCDISDFNSDFLSCNANSFSNTQCNSQELVSSNCYTNNEVYEELNNKIILNNGLPISFNLEEPYTFLKTLDYGNCAYPKNYNNVIELYNNYGCCPTMNYRNDGTCEIIPIQNNYCDQTHNGNGRSLIGAECNPTTGGNIDYDELSFHFTEGEQEIYIEYPRRIEYIEIVRMQYDNTFETVNENGETFGGSIEYYTDAIDCTSGMGNTITQYSSMAPTELWYILLGLRARGYDWKYIVENQTEIYNNFIILENNNLFWLNKIDIFLGEMNNIIIENNDVINAGVTIVKFNGTCSCVVGSEICGCYDSKNPTVLSNLDFGMSQESAYQSQNLTFKPLSSVEEKLFEINRNTQYMNLPLKWIFAYNDVVTLNQTALYGEEAECNLNYESIKGASIRPKTNCTQCEVNIVSDLDFSAVPASIMQEYLYEFSNVFLKNEYLVEGILE